MLEALKLRILGMGWDWTVEIIMGLTPYIHWAANAQSSFQWWTMGGRGCENPEKQVRNENQVALFLFFQPKDFGWKNKKSATWFSFLTLDHIHIIIWSFIVFEVLRSRRSVLFHLEGLHKHFNHFKTRKRLSIGRSHGMLRQILKRRSIGGINKVECSICAKIGVVRHWTSAIFHGGSKGWHVIDFSANVRSWLISRKWISCGFQFDTQIISLYWCFQVVDVQVNCSTYWTPCHHSTSTETRTKILAWESEFVPLESKNYHPMISWDLRSVVCMHFPITRDLQQDNTWNWTIKSKHASLSLNCLLIASLKKCCGCEWANWTSCSSRVEFTWVKHGRTEYFTAWYSGPYRYGVALQKRELRGLTIALPSCAILAATRRPLMPHSEGLMELKVTCSTAMSPLGNARTRSGMGLGFSLKKTYRRINSSD